MPLPTQSPGTQFPPRRITLRRLHRATAVAACTFLAVHIGHHLTLLDGPDLHLRLGERLAPFYRNPLITSIVMGLFLWQAGSGLWLFWRRGKPRNRHSWVQSLSGLYLALFLVQHIGAVLWGRLTGVDTDTEFAAAGLHAGAWAFYFAPYYTLAILAMGAHIASIGVLRKRPKMQTALIGLSGLVGVGIVAGLAGRPMF